MADIFDATLRGVLDIWGNPVFIAILAVVIIAIIIFYYYLHDATPIS